MKNHQQKPRMSLGLALAGVVCMASVSAHACSAEPFVGSVCATAANYCPKNYLEAKGQVLPLESKYYMIYALIGNRYGGDGHRTFALPDVRNGGVGGTPSSNVHAGHGLTYCIAVQGIWPNQP